MAYTLPNEDAPSVALGKGFAQGTNLYNMLMQHAVQRAQNKRAEELQPYTIKHLMSQIEHTNAADKRAQGLYGYRLQKLKNETDPNFKVNQLKGLLNALSQLDSGNLGGNEQGMPGQQVPLMQEGESVIPGINTQQPENQPMPNKPAVNKTGLDMNYLKQALINKSLGLPAPPMGPPKEAPEVKRQAELQNKLALEDYKKQSKIELEKTKANLENDKTRQKTIDAAKNDIPHLEKTLAAYKKMREIAADKKNADMFGHNILGYGVGENYSKRAKNPNVGAWQTYGIGPIVAAEQKMSARGNMLALKTALANKPNFDEDQAVALRKIETSIEEIENTIKENKKIAGEKFEENTDITELNGKKYKKINGEWYELR